MMLKRVSLFLPALLLALVLTLSAPLALAAEAESTTQASTEAATTEAASTTEGASTTEAMPESLADRLPTYIAFTGVVTEVRPFEGEEGKQFVLLSDDTAEGESLMNFVVDGSTVLLGDPKLEEGQKLTGFYDGNAPAILIFPPQMPALALTPYVEDQQAVMAQFDQDLVSVDGMLKIATDDATQVTLPNGDAFEGELGGHTLLVVYGPSTRSIPAQATAISVVVMDDVVGGGQTTLPEGATEMPGMTYTVKGVDVEAPAPFTNAEGVVMVPVKELVASMGLPEPTLNEETGVYNMGVIITFTPGKDYYTFARTAPIELGTAPVVVGEDVYVPLSFFVEVTKLKAADVEGNQIILQ